MKAAPITGSEFGGSRIAARLAAIKARQVELDRRIYKADSTIASNPDAFKVRPLATPAELGFLPKSKS